MKRRAPDVEPELEALLRSRTVERHAPPELRERALARARAILAAGGRISSARPHPQLQVRLPAPAARGRGSRRIALAASVMVAVGAVGAFAAFGGRTAQPPERVAPRRPPPTPAMQDDVIADPPSPGPLPRAVERAPVARPARLSRTAAGGDPVTAELELLQRAHASYTRHDFSGALILVAEHARRFPKGHLTEEREALRVRSLVALGRREEAHRAAAAFGARFPRSILLPRVEEGPESAKP
jgi:hypothetical protein